MNDIQIQGYRCKQCGRIHYPMHERCLSCHATEFELVAAQGPARLLTFTQIFNLPWGFDMRFLVIGVVQFESGIKAMGQIDVESVDNLELGMTLVPFWKPVRYRYGEPEYGLVLKPA